MDTKKVSLILGALVALLLVVTGKAQFSVGGTDPSGNPAEVTAPDVTQDSAEEQADAWLDDVGELVPPVASAGALAALAAFLVNIGKLTKIAPKLDGKSARVTLLISVGLYAGFTIANVFGVGDQFKDTVEKIGPLLAPALGLIAMFTGSKLFHTVMTWFDPNSFSLTARAASAATGARVAGSG